MILCLKADSQEVYIGVWRNGKEQVQKTWIAGRELSVHILSEIRTLTESADAKASDLEGIIVYEGPGSYTGLRISMSVANALAYSNQVKIVGSTGEKWVKKGLKKLDLPQGFTPIAPVYGGDVHTTKPKK